MNQTYPWLTASEREKFQPSLDFSDLIHTIEGMDEEGFFIRHSELDEQVSNLHVALDHYGREMKGVSIPIELLNRIADVSAKLRTNFKAETGKDL